MNDNYQKKLETGYIQESSLTRLIFDDPEAKRNFVGLFNQLLQMDMRNHPENYKSRNNDHD